MSGTVDDRLDQFDHLPPPDAGRHGTGLGLRDRLAQLRDTHPSSADYAAGPGLERAPDSRERPDQLALPPDKTVDRQRSDRVAAPELDWPSDIVLPADRRAHILDGDPNDGGGHRHGTGHPDKTEFPADWEDDRIIDAVLAVARDPDQPPQHQLNDRWRMESSRDGVQIVAIVAADGDVWTAWPREGSPGVVKNPVEEG